MRAAKRVGKLTTTRITEMTTEDGINAKVLAAGTIPWRIRNGVLQVLLIHRPKFDDWSWPKGRLNSQETLPETAWRETKEEVGLNLALGIPLGVIRYRTAHGQRRKEVWYWAARVEDQRPVPDVKEVDQVMWASVDQARRRLTNPLDRDPLNVLAQAYEAKQLSTVPFIVLRQAKPIPAESWTQDEIDRPLADSGYSQAKAVGRLLRAWNPQRILTSRYRRSLETIAPYVKKHGGAVRAKKWLNMRTATQHPGYLSKRLRQEFKRLEPTLLCSQPSVIKIILFDIKQWIRQSSATMNPKTVIAKKKSSLSPGSILVTHRAKHLGGRIVAVERYEPFLRS